MRIAQPLGGIFAYRIMLLTLLPQDQLAVGISVICEFEALCDVLPPIVCPGVFPLNKGISYASSVAVVTMFESAYVTYLKCSKLRFWH